jgi:hypothetical protein
LEAIEKPNLQDKLGLLYLVGTGFVFAGLVFFWITENFRVWGLLSFFGFGLVMIDHYVKKRIAPVPPFSVLNPLQSSKVKVPYNRYYVWRGARSVLPQLRIFRMSVFLRLSRWCF